jgi:hypoxanthine-guanine phosphoribosyltransferase
LITHYLGSEEVTAYCNDLVDRLVALEDNFPTVWFALGVSGLKMAIRVVRALPPELKAKVKFVAVRYNRSTTHLEITPPIDQLTFSDEPVLVIDSAVHSGKTMLALVQRLQAAKVKNIITYTLVLKRGSIIVPNYFGVIIDDKDRTLFELDPLPNNRLIEQIPFGIMRELKDSDTVASIGAVSAPFENLSTGDLLYDMETTFIRAYVFEYDGEIAGFISFRNQSNGILFIDAWATATKFMHRGIGNATFRWAETWARSTKCSEVTLWAYENAIPIYLKYGYEFVEGDKWRSLGEGQRYKIMRKKILYNLYEIREYAGPYAVH